MATQRIVAKTYEPLALYIEVAAIYLIFCTALTFLQKNVEKYIRFRFGDDFMTLPPEEKRHNHVPYKLDFGDDK